MMGGIVISMIGVGGSVGGTEVGGTSVSTEVFVGTIITCVFVGGTDVRVEVGRGVLVGMGVDVNVE
jgi:hypothetical protein